MRAMHGHEPFTSLTDTVSNVIWKSKCILQLIGPLPLSVHGHPPNPTMAKNGLLSLLRLHPISLSLSLCCLVRICIQRASPIALPASAANLVKAVGGGGGGGEEESKRKEHVSGIITLHVRGGP